MRNDIHTQNSVTQKARICLFGNAANIHFRRWATVLKDLGLNISVISYRKAELPNIDVYDISCTEMRISKYERYMRILRGIKMFLSLRRALKKIKPDIVHVHYLVNTPLVFGLWHKNLIVSAWGSDIIYDYGREPLSRVIYKKFLLRWAKEITTLSRFLGMRIQKYINYEPIFIPFGVDTSIFSGEQNHNLREITISFIKHLEEKYGPNYLIEAVPLILNEYKNVKINIVGNGSQELSLKKLVDKMRLQAHIKFLKNVSHTQVVQILRETDIFVMPSIYESESFGVAAIEASAMRIPVVASNVGGIKEAVVDGRTGILVPPRDARAIAAACIKLIKNKSFRKQLGNHGRNFVIQNYEWSRCVRKMVEIYDKILAR